MLAKLREMMGIIITVGALTTMIVGALTYFATAKDLQLVQLRLEEKILTDRVMDLKKQMWQLEEKNRKYGSDFRIWPDERDRKEYRLLQSELDDARTAKSKGVLK